MRMRARARGIFTTQTYLVVSQLSRVPRRRAIARWPARPRTVRSPPRRVRVNENATASGGAQSSRDPETGC